MGFDRHSFQFIRWQASSVPLGDVLTIGRQEVDSNLKGFAGEHEAALVDQKYCEPVLRSIGAKSVKSIDFSGYEGSNYIEDMGRILDLGEKFDTIIDSGSLEHIFNIDIAFYNIINHCKLGGRIIHILPVNNLNGHGFWQFSSDLIHALYSTENGFADTSVYYASSMDFSAWYAIPPAKIGQRTEVVSLEPIILLSVTTKVDEDRDPQVSQPFYNGLWTATDNSSLDVRDKVGAGLSIGKLRKYRLYRLLRNIWVVLGLATGMYKYSLSRRNFSRVLVKDAVRDL